jgi:hypothetical protein
MRAIAAFAARLPEVGRHVPGLLAWRFRVRFEVPTVCADHRPPALHAGEQKLKAERNPVRQHAGACNGQCSAKFDFRRRVAALGFFVDPVRISDLVPRPVGSLCPQQEIRHDRGMFLPLAVRQERPPCKALQSASNCSAENCNILQ